MFRLIAHPDYLENILAYAAGVPRYRNINSMFDEVSLNLESIQFLNLNQKYPYWNSDNIALSTFQLTRAALRNDIDAVLAMIHLMIFENYRIDLALKAIDVFYNNRMDQHGRLIYRKYQQLLDKYIDINEGVAFYSGSPSWKEIQYESLKEKGISRNAILDIISTNPDMRIPEILIQLLQYPKWNRIFPKHLKFTKVLVINKLMEVMKDETINGSMHLILIIESLVTIDDVAIMIYNRYDLWNPSIYSADLGDTTIQPDKRLAILMKLNLPIPSNIEKWD